MCVRVCLCVCVRTRRTNQEHNVGVEVDAKLDAIDNLLPSPSRYAKVGNQSHDWHCEKPEVEKERERERERG